MTDSADLLTSPHEKNLNLELRGQDIRSLDITIFGRYDNYFIDIDKNFIIDNNLNSRTMYKNMKDDLALEDKYFKNLTFELTS